jgi:hypothetical protein
MPVLEMPTLSIEEEAALFDGAIREWNIAHNIEHLVDQLVAVVGPKANLVRFVWARARDHYRMYDQVCPPPVNTAESVEQKLKECPFGSEGGIL